MIEISKTYFEKVPAMRFIGKQYSDADRVDGTFSYHWCKWNEENLFSIIREAAGGIHRQQQLYTDGEASVLGTGWIHDREDNLYCHECEVAQKLTENGHEIIMDSKGATCFFERYVDPRFSTPDKNGKVF